MDPKPNMFGGYRARVSESGPTSNSLLCGFCFSCPSSVLGPSELEKEFLNWSYWLDFWFRFQGM